MAVKIFIEYCGAWGYRSKANRLLDELRQKFPSLQADSFSMKQGRTSSFEVSVNGKVVWSKLENDKFPKTDDILPFVEAALKQ